MSLAQVSGESGGHSSPELREGGGLELWGQQDCAYDVFPRDRGLMTEAYPH